MAESLPPIFRLSQEILLCIVLEASDTYPDTPLATALVCKRLMAVSRDALLCNLTLTISPKRRSSNRLLFQTLSTNTELHGKVKTITINGAFPTMNSPTRRLTQSLIPQPELTPDEHARAFLGLQEPEVSLDLGFLCLAIRKLQGLKEIHWNVSADVPTGLIFAAFHSLPHTKIFVPKLSTIRTSNINGVVEEINIAELSGYQNNASFSEYACRISDRVPSHGYENLQHFLSSHQSLVSLKILNLAPNRHHLSINQNILPPLNDNTFPNLKHLSLINFSPRAAMHGSRPLGDITRFSALESLAVTDIEILRGQINNIINLRSLSITEPHKPLKDGRGYRRTRMVHDILHRSLSLETLELSNHVALFLGVPNQHHFPLTIGRTLKTLLLGGVPISTTRIQTLGQHCPLLSELGCGVTIVGPRAYGGRNPFYPGNTFYHLATQLVRVETYRLKVKVLLSSSAREHRSSHLGFLSLIKVASIWDFLWQERVRMIRSRPRANLPFLKEMDISGYSIVPWDPEKQRLRGRHPFCLTRQNSWFPSRLDYNMEAASFNKFFVRKSQNADRAANGEATIHCEHMDWIYKILKESADQSEASIAMKGALAAIVEEAVVPGRVTNVVTEDIGGFDLVSQPANR